MELLNKNFIYIFAVILTFQAINSFALTYTYDNLNRLASVTYGTDKVVTYSYDLAGNITKIQKSAGIPNVVNAACGNSNGVIAQAKPTSNLCSAGTATAVSGAGPWYWICESSNGGASPFCATATPVNVSVTLAGSGTGSVNSYPAGIACTNGSSSGCTAAYTIGTAVTLSATTSTDSSFTGWSGACSGTANCMISVTTDKSATATFGLAPKAKTGSTGYETLNAAFNNALPGAAILALDIELLESLNINLGKAVTIKGGYNSDFITRSGNLTQLKGTLTVSTGSLTVDGLTIK